MFLVLEDRAFDGPPAATSGPGTEGPELARLARCYGDLLGAEGPSVDEYQSVEVLEILAAKHFTGVS